MAQLVESPAATEVFISYRTKERTGADAELLHGHLTKRRINVFFDAMRLTPGDRWNEVIGVAARSPKLAVGVILMTDEWFRGFADDLARDIVWHEVRMLREQRCRQWHERRRQERRGDPHPPPEARIIPVVLRTAQTGDTTPRPPDPARPNHRPLAKLRSALGNLHYCWIPPKGPHRMDELVDDIAQTVQHTVLGRPLRDTITAERTPPLPLSTLRLEPATQRGLLDYAELESAHRDEHRFMTLRGQDALITHDWAAALTHLTRAKDNMDSDDLPPPSVLETPAAHDAGAAFRSDLWRMHLLNLFVVASLRGDRPRRRQITEASQMLVVLLRAIAIAASPRLEVPDGLAQQARVDRRSAAYVVELTLDLLWLLWNDFFLERNVRLPELRKTDPKEIKRGLDRVGHLLGELHRTEPLRGSVDERRFLVTHGYLDGLPHDPRAPERWATGSVLHGLQDLVDRELGA